MNVIRVDFGISQETMLSFDEARVVLRRPADQSYEAIDAAIEVLAYSPLITDRELVDCFQHYTRPNQIESNLRNQVTVAWLLAAVAALCFLGVWLSAQIF